MPVDDRNTVYECVTEGARVYSGFENLQEASRLLGLPLYVKE